MQSIEERRRKGKERMRRWRAANRERNYATHRKWRKANMDKSAESSRRWRESHPLAAAINNARRVYIGRTYVGTLTTTEDKSNGTGNGP